MADAIVYVTGMTAGEPSAEPASMVTFAEYWPAARLVDVMDTVTEPALLPLGGETLSQAASSLVLQDSVPAPALVIASCCDAGSAPPGVALNVSVVGATSSTAAVERFSVTGMTFGLPVAP